MDNIKCKYCESKTFNVRRNNKHLERLCAECGKHQQFDPQSVDDGSPASDAQFNYAVSLASKAKSMTASQAGTIIKMFKGS